MALLRPADCKLLARAPHWLPALTPRAQTVTPLLFARAAAQASGFGLHMGQQLQALGLHIAVLDVEPAALQTGVASLQDSAPEGCRVAGYLCDVSSLAQVEAAAEGVAKDFPDSPLGFVSANAGVGAGGILTATEDDWDWVSNT